MMRDLLSSVAAFWADEQAFLRINSTVGGGGGGMSPNASFTIVKETTDATIVAPHAQWFDVTSISGFAPAAPVSGGEVYNPQAHDITWIWDFGDTGAVPNTACNLPTAWRDTNTAYGKRVAHVYASPGTYTVTCWAYDNDGHYGTATTTVTVQDPAAVFPGNRTICVNPVGDSSFTGAPAGAQQINGLAAISAALPAGQTCRILLKRGATYTDALLPTPVQNQYYGAYGTGARPLLRPPVNSDSPIASVRQAPGTDGNKFVGLDFQGYWDVTSETGSDSGFLSTFQSFASNLLHDCRLRDFGGQSIGGEQTYPVNAVISNCLIENWRYFAIFLQGGETTNTRFAVIGTAMHMSADALHGIPNGFFDGRIGNLNGPFRNGYSSQAFFSCCSLFSNTGWSSANMFARSLAQRPGTADQEPLRMQSDANVDYNAAVPVLWNVERCVLEGGQSLVTMNQYPGNYIFDKVIMLGTAHMNNEFIALTGGTTLRNVFMWAPNTPITHDSPPHFIRVTAGSNPAGNSARPVRIYNCTAYSARTSANMNDAGGTNLNMVGLTGGSGIVFSDLIVENNIVHAPAQNTALTASAPVQMVAIPGLTTLYRGARWNFPALRQTLGANVPVGGTVTFAYPNDTSDHPNGRVTNQAYFLTPPGNNQHSLAGAGPIPALRSDRGQFSVTFGASSITVQNTSGVTWNAGSDLVLLLDRRNDIGPNVARFASPATVEVPVPIAGSPALNAAGVGRRSWDDLFGVVLGGNLTKTGATQSGTADKGAVQAA